jgi:hypothetical protein
MESHGVFVRIRVGLDVVSSQAIWEFQTVDPITGKHCRLALTNAIGFNTK